GALKGTYDTALGVQFYSSETRRTGTSSVTFKWGKVYVGDTSLGEPFREVMLHNGIPDSDIYASHDAMRDSIFQTEWFDWPVSAEINYNRLMLIPSVGTITYTVDTTVYYDSVGGLHTLYDTVPNNFIADSTIRTDSGFFTSYAQIQYTVQLVHQSGHIDTIEKAVYNPSLGKFIKPMTINIDNAGYADDTVMLQVIGSFTNVPDADSDVLFARETMLDTYPSYGDTTLAIGPGGIMMPPPDSCFIANGPFSNPSDPGADDISILVHYCASGSTITAQVYTSGGIPVGSPSTYTSDAQIWDRLPINAPGTSGTYYITVTVGSYSTTLGYSVY
ncbi:MAG TPA: hypothetical protein VFH95_03925, partial [Candidatus Kapabacteria bacterium]|nr:hypothetical protein [Candidatus Kapabacteria bacterium]